MLLFMLLCAWIHRERISELPPPDAEYPVFERDFVNRTAYLAFLERETLRL